MLYRFTEARSMRLMAALPVERKRLGLVLGSTRASGMCLEAKSRCAGGLASLDKVAALKSFPAGFGEIAQCLEH